MDVDDAAPSDRDEKASESAEESEADAPAELMVVSRSRRSNAGNRMSTLLAQAAQEDNEWGEEWAEAPNEEEFVGDDANDQDDFNMDSSSSEGEEDEGAEDDTGEKELRRAERQERIKKRKVATNPFAARLAAAARKKVKLDVPTTDQPAAPVRPKKKSERASWIPTPEDGPIRTSSRKQTVANKEHTMAKLKEKDRRRDDTLAMMKAAEARKAKDEPKAMTQAERLAEAARVERVNSKSLHRWEIAEEQRAAERQAQLDALKNRQIEGPFIRYYSGPAIWVDDKIKYTGKDAPTLEEVEREANKKILAGPKVENPSPAAVDQTAAGLPAMLENATDVSNQLPSVEAPAPSKLQQPPHTEDPSETAASQQAQPSQAPVQEHSTDSHSMPNPSTIMFAPPEIPTSFLSGLEQYASEQQGAPPQNTTQPTSQANETLVGRSQAPATSAATIPANPFQPPTSHPDATSLPPNPFYTPTAHDDPLLQTPQNANMLLHQFQRPPLPAAPPAPPRKKIIRRALRNLLILSSFPNLDAPISTTRARTTSSILKEKDRSALVQLSTTLFGWNTADATSFVTSILNAPKTKKERDTLPKIKRELCAVTNQIARYKDPGTGIAYRDQKAFKVLRGVVGGGFVWSGALGCYVGGRAKDRDSSSSGVKPAVGVPSRFVQMAKRVDVPAPTPTPATPSEKEKQVESQGNGTTAAANGGEATAVKTEEATAA